MPRISAQPAPQLARDLSLTLIFTQFFMNADQGGNWNDLLRLVPLEELDPQISSLESRIRGSGNHGGGDSGGSASAISCTPGAWGGTIAAFGMTKAGFHMFPLLAVLNLTAWLSRS